MKRFTADAAKLKNLPPFSWFSEAELAWALPAVQHRKCPARVFIQEAGEAADGLYILLRGRVQVVYRNNEGREFIAAMVRAHDFFGELGLFHGEKSTAHIRSVEACEMLFIPRDVLLECLQENARATLCMLEKVAKRLGACHRKFAQTALNDVDRRVAHVLIQNTRRIEREIVVDVGAEQIAGLVGCSRETVSRVVGRLIKQGLIRRHGRKLIVLDAHALGRIRNRRAVFAPSGT